MDRALGTWPISKNICDCVLLTGDNKFSGNWLKSRQFKQQRIIANMQKTSKSQQFKQQRMLSNVQKHSKLDWIATSERFNTNSCLSLHRQWALFLFSCYHDRYCSKINLYYILLICIIKELNLDTTCLMFWEKKAEVMPNHVCIGSIVEIK